jgi:hypothetical protein
MPRSLATRNLNEAAHSLGDEYYRCVTHKTRTKAGVEPCVDLARSYMAALEALRAHLQTLRFDHEVDSLIRSTESHIELVRKDLTAFEKRVGPDH